MTRELRFWGSAAGAAVSFTALVPVLFPFRAVGLDPSADRAHIWMLSTFCAGWLALMLGLGGTLTGRSMGFRDVYFARGVAPAVEQHRGSGRAGGSRRWMNAGVWTIAFGSALLAIYFVLLAAQN